MKIVTKQKIPLKMTFKLLNTTQPANNNPD